SDGSGGGALGPSSSPVAQDDNPNTHQTYIAYKSLPPLRGPIPRWSALNVAAAAGVLRNDTASIPGNHLVAQLVQDMGPFHGELKLHDDGSFSYHGNVDYIGYDTFQYRALEVETGQLSDPATVSVYVMDYSPQSFPLVGFTDKALTWPKMHFDTRNSGGGSGIPKWNSQIHPGLVPDTFDLTVFDPDHPVNYMGSPVVGLVNDPDMQRPVVYVQSDRGLHALNMNPDATFMGLRWTNPDVYHSDGPFQEVYSAPLLANSSAVAMGNGAGELFVLDGNDGSVISRFSTLQQTSDGHQSGGGPIASSPTAAYEGDLVNPQGGTGSYFDMLVEPLLIFGTDGLQNSNDPIDPGGSEGRVIACDPDGTVAYVTLLEGKVHGSPLVTPASGASENERGKVYVGTAHGGGPNPLTGTGVFY